MSAADKARYFLEQSLPELREYERKNIFTVPEIAAISKRRSDFEHRINAPGCSLSDFTRYAAYEMNLESLYRKRTKRLGIRARLHFGARRVFFVFERATRKFPGDVGLWVQYVEFAKREKASNVVGATVAKALKLHSGKAELWVWAAAEALERGDVTEGRSHMQRGLRFNKKSRMLWREYAKLEMGFVAKVMARRALLGIDGPRERAVAVGDEGDDVMRLPVVAANELEPELARKDLSFDMMALENVDTNPALNGALAVAIFDQAMKEVPGDAAFAMEFYELFQQFPQLKCCRTLLEHVVKYLLEVAPTKPEVLWTAVQLPLFAVEVAQPEFPARLGEVLEKMAKALEKCESRKTLYENCTTRFVGLLREADEMDEAVKKVLGASATKYFKQAEKENEVTPKMYQGWSGLLEWRGKKEEALRIEQRALARFPGEGMRDTVDTLR